MGKYFIPVTEKPGRPCPYEEALIHVRAWIRNSFRVGHTTMYYFVYRINTIAL